MTTWAERGMRWDTDERHVGVADAGVAVEGLRRLLEMCGTDGWVTEDADAHLGGHLRELAPTAGFRWVGARQGDDGVFVVDVATTAQPHEAYRRGVALLAAVAESSFAVRRLDAWTLDCVTGMLPGDGEFATHGHTVRLRIRPEGDS